MGVALSVDGEAWLPAVKSALRDLSESDEDVFGIPRDRLTLSASASVTELWLTPRLAAWPARGRPRIVFATRVLASASATKGADLRMERGRGDWPDHYKVRLDPEALCPVAAPSLLDGGDDWRDLPHTGSPVHAPGGRTGHGFRAIRLRPRRTWGSTTLPLPCPLRSPDVAFCWPLCRSVPSRLPKAGSDACRTGC